MHRLIIRLSFIALFAAPSFAKNLYIPVGGVAQGANNTLFRTDVRLFNPSASLPISVSVHFQPAGMDGSNIPGRLVSIGPRQLVVLNDVVTFLGWPAPAIGAIRLDSDTDRSYEFVAESRTYTDSPNSAAPGTFGQFIPALDPADALRKIVITHLSHSASLSTGFRTNAGAMNPNAEPAIVTPRLFAADGTLVAEGQAFTVPPHSVIHLSLPAMIGNPSLELADGYLLLDATQPVFGYGSVVDNRSADQFFVVGAEDRAD
jgi:hypothetical protein